MNVDEAMAKWKELREQYDWPKYSPTLTDIFVAEVERLRAEVQRLDIAGTHTCHESCPKLPCVQRREIERLRAELAKENASAEVIISENELLRMTNQKLATELAAAKAEVHFLKENRDAFMRLAAGMIADEDQPPPEA